MAPPWLQTYHFNMSHMTKYYIPPYVMQITTVDDSLWWRHSIILQPLSFGQYLWLDVSLWSIIWPTKLTWYPSLVLLIWPNTTICSMFKISRHIEVCWDLYRFYAGWIDESPCKNAVTSFNEQLRNIIAPPMIN